MTYDTVPDGDGVRVIDRAAVWADIARREREDGLAVHRAPDHPVRRSN